MKVLFVCEGNICRSPMAEIIFRNICKKNGRDDIIVKSAGTYVTNWRESDGDMMLENSKLALVRCGEELPEVPHRATQFTYEMNDEYDYVIDVRRFPDPFHGSIEVYIDLCKQLQDYCAKLYNEICKTL